MVFPDFGSLSCLKKACLCVFFRKRTSVFSWLLDFIEAANAGVSCPARGFFGFFFGAFVPWFFRFPCVPCLVFCRCVVLLGLVLFAFPTATSIVTRLFKWFDYFKGLDRLQTVHNRSKPCKPS